MRIWVKSKYINIVELANTNFEIVESTSIFSYIYFLLNKYITEIPIDTDIGSIIIPMLLKLKFCHKGNIQSKEYKKIRNTDVIITNI